MKTVRIKTWATIFLAGMLGIHVATVWIVRAYIPQGRPDFKIYYTEGQILRLGLGTQLYNESIQAQFQRELGCDECPPVQVLPYMHPPFEALVFAPLTYFSFTQAYVLWSLLNLALLVLVALQFKNNFSSLSHVHSVILTLAMLAFFPIFLALLEGQDSILLLFCYCSAYATFKRGSDFRTGCWLALGLFRIHLVAPFLLVMALNRKWRLVAGFFSFAGMLGALSVAVTGWRGFLRYPIYVWSLERYRSSLVIPARYIPNFRGLLEYGAAPWASRLAVLAMVLAVSAAALVWVATKWRYVTTPNSTSFDFAFSLTILVTILVSYHGFLYDFSLLILPVMVVVNYIGAHSHDGKVLQFRLLMPMLVLFLTPLYVLLWYRCGLSTLMAFAPLGWALAISRELSQCRVSQHAKVAST